MRIFTQASIWLREIIQASIWLRDITQTSIWLKKVTQASIWLTLVNQANIGTFPKKLLFFMKTTIVVVKSNTFSAVSQHTYHLEGWLYWWKVMASLHIGHEISISHLVLHYFRYKMAAEICFGFPQLYLSSHSRWTPCINLK